MTGRPSSKSQDESPQQASTVLMPWSQASHRKYWEENCQARIPYQFYTFFQKKKKSETQTFLDLLKLKEFISSRPSLQEILKEAIQAEGE